MAFACFPPSSVTCLASFRLLLVLFSTAFQVPARAAGVVALVELKTHCHSVDWRWIGLIGIHGGAGGRTLRRTGRDTCPCQLLQESGGPGGWERHLVHWPVELCTLPWCVAKIPSKSINFVPVNLGVGSNTWFAAFSSSAPCPSAWRRSPNIFKFLWLLGTTSRCRFPIQILHPVSVRGPIPKYCGVSQPVGSDVSG